MSQRVDFEDDVKTLWFQLEHDDHDAKMKLLERIADVIDRDLAKYRLPDENTKITVRMFTKRC